MPTEAATHDVVVIGGGPGGYAAALYGASCGLDVVLIEKDKVGGTCLHRGCIPAKEFLETAAAWRHVRSAGEFGISAGEPTIDFATSQSRKADVVDLLFKGLSATLKNRSITVLDGTGHLEADGTVTITGGADDGVVLHATRGVVLAAGSTPRTLPGLEVDGRLVVTSDEFLDLDRLPASAVVVGGGAIGCEFASMLSDLGTTVTIVEGLPTILAGCDAEVASQVARSFKKRSIAMVTGATVTGHEPSSESSTTSLLVDGHEGIEAEMIVVSVGRQPATDGLVDEDAGVAIDERGFVVTDGHQRTSRPGVWAVGDIVAGSPQLAHVGFAEAMVAIKDLLGEAAVPVDYARVPWAIYCHPEVAFAGLTEAQAKEQGYDVVTKKDPFGGNGRARIIGETEGMVKVVAERRPDGSAGRVLGVHMVGPWVTEQLGAGYLAVNWEAEVDEVASLIQPHPSLSETFGETMIALTGRGLHVG
jgi:dihydrolipoamide dehydrogenase